MRQCDGGAVKELKRILLRGNIIGKEVVICLSDVELKS